MATTNVANTITYTNSQRLKLKIARGSAIKPTTRRTLTTIASQHAASTPRVIRNWKRFADSGRADGGAG